VIEERCTRCSALIPEDEVTLIVTVQFRPPGMADSGRSFARRLCERCANELRLWWASGDVRS
jgi:hypothetical protein